jgi:formiminotetrahydrofolate cyclodeaminase
MEKLLHLTAEQLLQKFGAGSHKPGSGSAMAFQGMLSAQLLKTVIDLTTQNGRKEVYREWLPELYRIKKEIEERIYLNLEEL